MSAQALQDYGVEYVVTSPGSRNAPLIVALNKEPELKVLSVIDERSAAFIAVGIASMTGKPVAIACTSGSAFTQLRSGIIRSVLSWLASDCFIGRSHGQSH